MLYTYLGVVDFAVNKQFETGIEFLEKQEEEISTGRVLPSSKLPALISLSSTKKRLSL
jgi:UDP-N-acetylglucosamine pyrophosphorylase